MSDANEQTKRIAELVYQAVESVNRMAEEGAQIATSPETILIGQGGVIDSLGMINLMVEIESLVEENYDTAIELTQEPMDESGPFLTLGSLIEFIGSRVNG